MPSKSRKQENTGLSALLEGLVSAGVEFILVGGLATVVQGSPVTTMDVDIVPHQTPENIRRLLVFLKSIGAFHRRSDKKVITPTEEHLSAKGHSLFTTPFGPLDVLAVIEEGKSYQDLFEHTIKIDFHGHTITVLDLETLIALKRTSKDPKEKLRLPILEATLSQLKKSKEKNKSKKQSLRKTGN
jgi:predicted nucleotidyltransferase